MDQSSNISINKTDVDILDILKSIEEQTEYLFIYNRKELNHKKTLNVSNRSIKETLSTLFDDTDIEYEIEGYHIILNKRANHTPSISQQNRKIIRGVILESSGEAAIGANVSVKGTSRGTITNMDGEYSLEVAEDEILVISYIGFLNQEVRVGSNSTINVTLKEDSKLLDEVVVVGYGIQKKANLTGSVATISASDIASRSVTNTSSALAGLAAGVRVNQTSSRPGSDGATIRLRGQGTLSSNSVLVIVDGIEGDIDQVNPNDIAEMSILKDAASASIYGARAANGVILITTKTGTKGKPKISFSGTLSMAKATRLPEYVSDYPTYLQLFNESMESMGQTPKFTQAIIDTWIEANKNPNALNEYGYPNYVTYPNTNWGDAVFENNWIQNYTLSIAGGSETGRYSLSASYQNNPGIIDNTGMERYQARINLESTVGGFLTFGTNTALLLQKNQMGSDDAWFDNIRQTSPGVYAYEYDGFWGLPSATGEEPMMGSPLRSLRSSGGEKKTSRVNTTLFGRLDILQGLTFETKVNYRAYFYDSNSYPITSMRKNFSNDQVTNPTTPENMTTSYTRNRNHQLTFDNVLRYNFQIKQDHDFGLLIGHNEYYYKSNNISGSKKGLIAEGIYVFDSAGEIENKLSGSESDRSMRSFFGRFNYGYKSKYLFEFNLRHDGSSRFGSERRYGNFPSVSAAWRITEESFAAPLRTYFQNLKLRASWGKLGNDAAGDYAYQAFYATTKYSFNDNPLSGLAQTKMANPYLQWETTEVKDLAIDATFLDSRANIELIYYDKYTSGILTTPAIYLTAGNVSGPTQNTADVLNRGIEISMGWNDQIGKVRYGVKGNFSYNYNRVKKYLGKYEVNENGSNNLSQISGSTADGYILEDHMIGEYYVRRLYRGDGSYFHSDGTVNINGGPTSGMIRTEEDMAWVMAMKEADYKFAPVNGVSKSQLWYGDMLYADLNGDGVFGDDNDREFTGKSALPKYNYGFTIDAAWNNFDISMIWAGSAGMSYYFLARGYNTSEVRESGAISLDVANNHYFFDPDNPSDPRTNLNALYPRLMYSQSSENGLNGASSERWIYNASYLKLKNLQIGYTVPSRISEKAKMSHLRLFVSGENLLMFTPYPFMDPERGKAIGYLPMKQFAFGLNINF